MSIAIDADHSAAGVIGRRCLAPPSDPRSMQKTLPWLDEVIRDRLCHGPHLVGLLGIRVVAFRCRPCTGRARTGNGTSRPRPATGWRACYRTVARTAGC